MKRLFIISVAIILLSFGGKVYSQTLIPPEFPGGKQAFGEFLNKNLAWPKSDNFKSQGTVVISFFVEKTGQLTDLKVAKSMSPDFNKKALRVMNLSPKWVPAFKNNKPIKSKSSAHIEFYTSG